MTLALRAALGFREEENMTLGPQISRLVGKEDTSRETFNAIRQWQDGQRVPRVLWEPWRGFPAPEGGARVGVARGVQQLAVSLCGSHKDDELKS